MEEWCSITIPELFIYHCATICMCGQAAVQCGGATATAAIHVGGTFQLATGSSSSRQCHKFSPSIWLVLLIDI